jgi:hypothetical protein
MTDPSYTYKLTNNAATVFVKVEIGGGYGGVATAVLDDGGNEVARPLNEAPVPAQKDVATSVACIDRDLTVFATANQPPAAPANPPKPILTVTFWETLGGASTNVQSLTKIGDRPTAGATSTISMLVSFLPPANL